DLGATATAAAAATRSNHGDHQQRSKPKRDPLQRGTTGHSSPPLAGHAPDSQNLPRPYPGPGISIQIRDAMSYGIGNMGRGVLDAVPKSGGERFAALAGTLGLRRHDEA